MTRRPGIATRHASGTTRARATAIGVIVGALAIACSPAYADEPRSAFRPCIDPGNLPFANEHGDGFENRIAELFAQKLGLPVKSYSFPQRMNFIRNTLRYRLPGEDYRCDVVMSLPVGFEQRRRRSPTTARRMRSSTRRARGSMQSAAAPTSSRCRPKCATACASASTTSRPPRSGS
jgi:hypothetical protein